MIETKLLKELIRLYYTVDNIIPFDKEIDDETSNQRDTIISKNFVHFLKNINLYDTFLNILREANYDKYQKYMSGKVKEIVPSFIYILNKLNENLRYELLNDNVKIELELLKRYNPYAYENLDSIIVTACKSMKKYLNNNNDNNDKKTTIFPIKNSLIIATNYLKEIDKSESLVELFNELLKNKKIILWNSSNKSKELELIKDYSELITYPKDWKTFNQNEELYINAPFENNILDIYKLIHEFMHYYIISSRKDMYDYTTTENFFSEFIPIFYETRLSKYLEKNGIKQSLTYTAKLERQKYILNDINSLIDISNLFKIQANSEKISEYNLKDIYKLDALKEKVSKLSDSEKEDFYASLLEYGIDLNDFETTSKNMCDNLNIDIITSKYTIHNSINYIVAKLLTEYLDNEINNGKHYLEDRVLYLSKNLATTNKTEEEILEFLECENVFFKLNKKEKTAIKLPKKID